ncbi:MAG: hypothetical protein ABSD73_07030 [Candidatus Bathyarchaeia archaeon]|jgi:hypothetical protein
MGIYTITGSFDVVISHTLRRLVDVKLVKRRDEGHKNVSYVITKKGYKQLSLLHVNQTLSEMTPVEVQVIEFLMHELTTIVDITTPYGASIENYLKNLRAKLNDDTVIEQAKALLDDPRKLYAEYSKNLQRYERKRQLSKTRSFHQGS